MNLKARLAPIATLRLALYDGTQRLYLLDDPHAGDLAMVPPGGVYEPRVHLAYILARQGHDAAWLARFAELPYPAARAIAHAAGR